MDRGTGMRLRMVHARRSVCKCGHAFTLKREARITASSPAKRKRALESLEDTLRRQESNRTRMAIMRASETQEQTLERLEQNRTRIASMRASKTLHVMLHKRRKNKEAMANARTRTVLIETLLHSILKSNWDLSLSVHVVIAWCTGKVLLPVTKGNILKLVLMYFTKCSVLIIHTWDTCHNFCTTLPTDFNWCAIFYIIRHPWKYRTCTLECRGFAL